MVTFTHWFIRTFWSFSRLLFSTEVLLLICIDSFRIDSSLLLPSYQHFHWCVLRSTFSQYFWTLILLLCHTNQLIKISFLCVIIFITTFRPLYTQIHILLKFLNQDYIIIVDWFIQNSFLVFYLNISADGLSGLYSIWMSEAWRCYY